MSAMSSNPYVKGAWPTPSFSDKPMSSCFFWSTLDIEGGAPVPAPTEAPAAPAPTPETSTSYSYEFDNVDDDDCTACDDAEMVLTAEDWDLLEIFEYELVCDPACLVAEELDGCAAFGLPLECRAIPMDGMPAPTPEPMGCMGDPVPAWEQCGGDSWEGSTCCGEGLECTAMGGGTCYWQVTKTAREDRREAKPPVL